ncbi:hybrid sensor histidine kinase/response regulator [Marinicella sp. S1101]|uniref:ATP-binding response regulator n=1 Tax=Marinicella marina TaxID=2996016 RepID=UPI00226086A0|nr:hybrid sensor histidine kinase/response regulator [Marinicella marina]MCX7552871.1 hybrid sensor histidine kinase/response regulator [Marinicella marina]
MKIPQGIFNRVYDHYQASDWCLITLDRKNTVKNFNRNAETAFALSHQQNNIRDVIPLLAAESLDEEFMLPFFNHNEKVFDVHFLIEGDYKHLIMVPIDMLHKQVQSRQQIAHEQEIEKLRLEGLFVALEGAHEELKKANSAKSFYISALSHEIGNPITAIKGYNQLLMEGAIEQEAATKVFQNNIEKIQQIITQTLDYDQQYNTQYSRQLAPAQVIDQLFNDFSIQASNKGLKLINQVDPEVIIKTNQTKWSQIFTNLISNAIKYTEKGSITVKSQLEDGLLHIDTIDTGCGMSPAFQSKLFTAWSREKKSQSAGNGIGLVISKMLAEQIGGDLILHSSNQHGSRFRFSVTYHQALNAQRILLVDDDADCLSLFDFYLTEAGHEVTTAHSIQSIEQKLAEKDFDVVLTDLNLTDGSVDQIHQKLKSQVARVVIMTANSTKQKRHELETLGFDQVLNKPLTQEQIVNSVA